MWRDKPCCCRLHHMGSAGGHARRQRRESQQALGGRQAVASGVGSRQAVASRQQAVLASRLQAVGGRKAVG